MVDSSDATPGIPCPPVARFSPAQIPMRLSFRSVLITSFCWMIGSVSAFSAEPTDPAGNDEVRKIMETFGGRGVQSDGSKGLPPAEALKSFKLRDGLAID